MEEVGHPVKKQNVYGRNLGAVFGDLNFRLETVGSGKKTMKQDLKVTFNFIRCIIYRAMITR